ncbi:hypothetical protein MUG84_15795 [Paenibacillus sp. KQZ6P-2]|uniref:Uncharacterized protein n=1 Tax=Paenibacillus mangrovi TaxID=2931978 RepID=A0A9X1WSM9_9BACL|nr:hypothetical protein [Paenibacillus mangrovi]MCJ8013195.1 hypothetical protein [Paenibacillus mangrovi]
MSGNHIQIHHAFEGRLWVILPPEKEWIRRIRSVHGRKWHPEIKQWSIPGGDESVAVFVELFSNCPVLTDESMRDLFPQLRRLSPHGERWRVIYTEALKMKGYSTNTEKAGEPIFQKSGQDQRRRRNCLLFFQLQKYLYFSKALRTSSTALC